MPASVLLDGWKNPDRGIDAKKFNLCFIISGDFASFGLRVCGLSSGFQ